MKKILLLFLSILFCAEALAQEYELKVEIEDVHGEGEVYILLFEEGQKFRADSEECYRQGCTASNGKALIRITGLSKGKYAFMLYHDENKNGILDTNIMGMPREGVGTSNNIQGIPSFKKCAFMLDKDLAMSISMVYMD